MKEKRSLTTRLDAAPRLLSLVCGLALTASTLVAAPYFGFDHAPLGSALLSQAPDGKLMITNIGASGNDGVSIDAGTTRGIALDLDLGPRGMLPPNLDLNLSVHQDADLRACNLRIVGTGDGRASIGLHTDGRAPSSVTVTLIDDGQIVETAQHHGQIPEFLLDGDFGTAPGEDGLHFEFAQSEWGYSWTISSKATPLLIHHVASGPRPAKRVRVFINGLPPGEPVIDRVHVQGSNLPGGTLAIAGEASVLPMSVATEDGFNDAMFSASALGGAMLGTGDPCAGCLECCVTYAGSLNPASAWHVGNLGGGGQDGVRISTRAGSIGDDGVHSVSFNTSPIDLADFGDSLRFEATGRLADAPGSPLGFITLTNAGPVLLDADYSAVGSDHVRIVVFNHGVPAGFVDVAGGTGTPVAEILPTGPSVRVSKCGKRGGIGQPPCFVMCTPEPVLVIASGQVMFGDDIRVLAMNASGSVDALETFEITGAGLDPLGVAPFRDAGSGGAGGEILVVDRIRVASMNEGAVESLPNGGFRMTAIPGSPGVMVMDLASGQGVEIDFPGGMSLSEDQLFDFGFRENDGVAGGDIYRGTWELPSGGSTEFTVGGGALCPTVSLVELFRENGDPIGFFLAATGERSTSYDIKKIEKAGARTRDGWECHCPPPPAFLEPVPVLEMTVADENGGGITLIAPDGTPYDDVRHMRMMAINGLLPRDWHGTAGVASLTIETIQQPVVVVGSIDSWSFGASNPSTVGPGSNGSAGGRIASQVSRRPEPNSDDRSIRTRVALPDSDGANALFVRPNRNGPRSGDCDEPGIVGMRFALDQHGGKADFVGEGCFLQLPGMMDVCYSFQIVHDSPASSSVVVGSSNPAGVAAISVIVEDANGGVLAEQHNLMPGAVATLLAPPGGSINWPSGFETVHKASAREGFFDLDDGFTDVTVLLNSGVAVPHAAGLRLCVFSTESAGPGELAYVRIGGELHGSGRWGFDVVDQSFIRDEPPTCPADLAPPFGVLDLGDINAFVVGFTTQDLIADLAPPFGVLDLADINAFVSAFVAGCP